MKMNERNNGVCNTEGLYDPGEYNVPADHEKMSPLTGSANNPNSLMDKFLAWVVGAQCFTCVELEVFALE